MLAVEIRDVLPHEFKPGQSGIDVGFGLSANQETVRLQILNNTAVTPNRQMNKVWIAVLAPTRTVLLNSTKCFPVSVLVFLSIEAEEQLHARVYSKL